MGPILIHTQTSRGGNSPSLRGVAEPPQGPPLRLEVVAVAAAVATPAKEEGLCSLRGGSRANRSLLVPPHPTPMIFQTHPLMEGARGEAMTGPRKRRYQATLPRPQMTTIPDDIGDYITRYM